MSTFWSQIRFLNPYQIHKLLINDYILKKPGDTILLKRDTSKDRTDIDVIKQNHKFLWEEDDKTDSWELQFAKRYYDKLFKEYCIADLILYKENKIALRWRTEKEVIIGKGQFICGNKKCTEENDLRTWEVNFAYTEHGSKKNALVKVRLCRNCSKKLNYHSKKREIKRLRNIKVNSVNISNNKVSENVKPSTSFTESVCEISEDNMITKNDKNNKCKLNTDDESLWENHKQMEPKSREEEMEEYLQDLLL